jgi:hypothetical protein
VAVVGGLSLLGPLVLAVDQKLEVGRFDAYLLVQRKYDHSLHEPLAPIVNAVNDLWSAPAAQTLFVAIVVGCSLVWLAVRRRDASRPDLLVGIWTALAWLLPHVQANVSLARSQAALAPVALLVRRMPRVVLVALLAVAVWLSVEMTQLFLDGKLV